MGKSRVWLLGCGLAAIGMMYESSPCPAADPASPTTQHDPKAEALARASARKAVSKAVAALAKEYEAHADNATVPLRAKSNYFQDNPSPQVTVDAIMSVLEQSDGPAAEECYIKWQLLSGMPAKADEALVPRIGDLYANAPGPIPNPSLTSTNKSQLDSQMMRMTSDQEEMVNTAWTKHISEWAAGNAPILGYNETLFGMLPESLGAMTLGLQDAYQRRAAAGVDCDDFINQVLSEARDWAVTASPDQLQAAAQQCARLSKLYVNGFPPSVYTSVKWDENGHQLRWQSGGIHCVSKDTIDAFQKFLRDLANAPGGGIQAKPAN